MLAQTFVCLTLLGSCTPNLTKFGLIFPIPKNYNFTIDLLRKLPFQTYDLIFHVNNVTAQNANRFLATQPTFITIFNHEVGTTREMRRPEGWRCFHIVAFHQPLKFAQFLSRKENVFADDVFFIVTYDNTFMEMALNYSWIPNLSKSGRVIIMNYGAELIDIYNICFYCGRFNGLGHLKTMTYQKFELERQYLFPQKFDNLQGHQFRVAYINYFPYLYCTRTGPAGVCLEATGAEYELLETLSRILNFTYQLIEVPDQNYTLLFDSLVLEKYDFAVGGLSVTKKRRETLQFSDVLRFEKMALFFVYEPPLLSKLVVLNQVKSEVQVVLTVCLCSFAFVIYSVGKLINFGLSYLKSCTSLVRAAVEQPLPTHLLIPDCFKWSLSILITTWWLFCLILNVILKSRLTAAMVQEPVPKLTTEEIFSKYMILMDSSVSSDYLDIFFKEEKKQIQEPLLWESNLCTLFQTVQHGNVLMLGEVSRNLLHIRIFCSDFYNRSVQPVSHFYAHEIRVTAHAWPFKYGAPFVQTFNKCIKKAMSGGLDQIWKDKALERRKLYTYSRRILDEENQSINFDTFLAQFVMYLMMVAGCFGCFLVEIVYYGVVTKLG